MSRRARYTDVQNDTEKRKKKNSVKEQMKYSCYIRITIDVLVVIVITVNPKLLKQNITIESTSHSTNEGIALVMNMCHHLV